MKYLVTLLPFALSALAIAPQASPSPNIKAPGGPPPGCVSTYSGSFGLGTEYLPGEPQTTAGAGTGGSSRRKRTPPAEGPASPLSTSLENGVLSDSSGGFAYIASNHQYQYNNPIQAGAIYTTGWSVCPNMTLALGDSTVFYQCISGNFYNLYNTPIRSGCIPVNLNLINTSGTAVSSASSYVASSTAAASTPASSSTPAPATTTSAAPAPATTTAAAASSAPAYTGAAAPLNVGGSFFAVAAGAMGLAMI